MSIIHRASGSAAAAAAECLETHAILDSKPSLRFLGGRVEYHSHLHQMVRGVPVAAPDLAHAEDRTRSCMRKLGHHHWAFLVVHWDDGSAYKVSHRKGENIHIHVCA